MRVKQSVLQIDGVCMRCKRSRTKAFVPMASFVTLCEELSSLIFAIVAFWKKELNKHIKQRFIENKCIIESKGAQWQCILTNVYGSSMPDLYVLLSLITKHSRD